MQPKKTDEKKLETPHKIPNKVKDTKRWCKGIVGREHVLKWGPNEKWMNMWPYNIHHQVLSVRKCVNCGKEFDYAGPGFGTYGPGF